MTLVTIHHERVATTRVAVLLITIMNQEGVAVLPPAPVAPSLEELLVPKVPRMHLLLIMMRMAMLLAKVKNTVKASLL